MTFSPAVHRQLIDIATVRAHHNAQERARRKARRAEAIAHLGGHCVFCGSKRHLEFDHIARDTKAIASNLLVTTRKVVFWAEIAKCQLLCRKCHPGKCAAEERAAWTSSLAAAAVRGIVGQEVATW